jgi:RNA polymerase sigma-70 factor, ECF subfamily
MGAAGMNVAGDIERVARLSHGRLVARIAIRSGNVAAAADAVSDALMKALEWWPVQGIPANPEAWLYTVARNRAADAMRAGRGAASALSHLALLEEERAEMADAATPDQVLNLMFVCAHPAIAPPMRTPLMLQLVLGLDARRMAGAFLVPPGTLGQRLTRARAKIEAARIGFGLPEGADLAPRLRHVLDAIYAAFTVGIDGAGAGDAKASELAQEAVWLGSLVANQLPNEAEGHGLFALMLYTMARRPARLDHAGLFVPLAEQDPALWDAGLLQDADRAMRHAARNRSLGRYQIEASIAAALCDRRHGRPTDYAAIVHLHEGLAALFPSTGAQVGLAGALAAAGDFARALDVLDAIVPDQAASYQPWWAVRTHVLDEMGSTVAATAARSRALALTVDPAVRAFLARQGQ